jgi:hypothetical protein
MARLDKLLAAMRRNPRADRRIEQLKAIADRYGIAHRQPGTSQRPVKPVYVALIEAQETTDGDPT